jgi:hypothetical protein
LVRRESIAWLQPTQPEGGDAEVFAFVADMNNIPKWQSEVVTSKVITPGPTRVGTQFTEDVKMGPTHTRATCEVTEFTPNSLMGFSALSPRMNYQARLTVEPSGEGSNVTMNVGAQMKGWWNFMQPLLKGEFRSGLRKELTSLKAVLEGRT